MPNIIVVISVYISKTSCQHNTLTIIYIESESRLLYNISCSYYETIFESYLESAKHSTNNKIGLKKINSCIKRSPSIFVFFYHQFALQSCFLHDDVGFLVLSYRWLTWDYILVSCTMIQTIRLLVISLLNFSYFFFH